ncbi:hypothetical protein D3C87_1198680 [compost metagenome]
MRRIRRKYHHQVFQHLAVFAFQLGQFIHRNHKARNRSIEREAFNIVLYFFNDLVQGFQLSFGRHRIANMEIPVLVMEQTPELAQEFKHPFNTIRIPWFALLQRAQKHFIHPQGISSIAFNQHIRVYHVEFRFGHLFNLNTTNVFAVFKDKFRSCKFRSEQFKLLNVQHFIVHNIYIYMQCRCFIIFS